MRTFNPLHKRTSADTTSAPPVTAGHGGAVTNCAQERSRGGRKRALHGAVLAVTLVLAALLLASPSFAARGYSFQTSFGAFAFPASVATDASGDVYVLDAGTGSLSKYSPTGTPVDFMNSSTNVIEGVGGSPAESEIAVDNTTSGPDAGDIFVANGGHIGIYSQEGLPVEVGGKPAELTSAVETEVPGAPWGEPCGVAVSPSGDVYVGLFPNHVSKYVPNGGVVENKNYAGTVTSVPFLELCNVAVDGAGDVYAANYEGHEVTEFTATQSGKGEVIGTTLATSGPTLTADAAGDVFIDEGAQVTKYNSAGEPVRVISGGPAGTPFESSYGVAVNTAGELFVADAAHGTLDAFEPVVAPDATTTPASGILPLEVKLNGIVNPLGFPSKYAFEYGTSTAYGNEVAASPLESTSGGETPVSAALTGLKPQTIYHYRVVATSSNGVTKGADETFTTAGPLATVTAASGITSSSVTLAGALNTLGLTGGTYRFVVTSTTSPYTTNSAQLAVPAAGGEVPVSATIDDLPAGGAYSARLIVSAGGVTTYSAPAAFSTPGTPGEAPQQTPNISNNPYAGLTVAPSAPPPSSTTPPSKPAVVKPLTKAQKLKKALALCKKDKKGGKRKSCEASARHKYGTPKKKKRSR